MSRSLPIGRSAPSSATHSWRVVSVDGSTASLPSSLAAPVGVSRAGAGESTSLGSRAADEATANSLARKTKAAQRNSVEMPSPAPSFDDALLATRLATSKRAKPPTAAFPVPAKAEGLIQTARVADRSAATVAAAGRDRQLARVIERWPCLPSAVQQAILALAEAAEPPLGR